MTERSAGVNARHADTRMTTLRDAQVAALTSLLTLNQPQVANGSSSAPAVAPIPTWKVLIMDKIAQDVMATSLRVQDLRDQGVTLHMSVSLSDSRDGPGSQCMLRGACAIRPQGGCRVAQDSVRRSGSAGRSLKVAVAIERSATRSRCEAGPRLHVTAKPHGQHSTATGRRREGTRVALGSTWRSIR